MCTQPRHRYEGIRELRDAEDMLRNVLIATN